MAIHSGTRVGPYEVGEVIGSGGMGDVYRATDTTLDREVAIKALPRSFASDAGRVARFEQEAKVLASLNHPNIAQIYGLERGGESALIVMELVEGATLADRIARGPIPADEALAIAMQIAAALEAAHDRGIVHRDLKPANIKLRPDGTVKVLDFGIAKPFDAGPLKSGPQSPVMTTPVTQAGVILGTAAYMSPEQARGKPVDQRADIWAFGCVLFEMLTGQPVFAGEDVSITLARVLERDTNLDSMPQAIAPAVRQTIAVCLRKDPRKRFHSIADVRLALAGELLAETSNATADGARAAAGSYWRRALPLAIGLVVGGAIVGAAVDGRGGDEAPRPVVRIVEPLEPVPNLPVLAISDDGQRIAYTEGSPPRLMLRELNEYTARPVANADVSPGRGAAVGALCFSPDGDEIAHFSDNGSVLRKTPLAGGRGVPLATELAETGGSCDWADDGFIYFGGDRLARVPAAGGPVERLSEPDLAVDETGQVSPQLLPGGRLVAYSMVSRDNLVDSMRVGILDLETRQTTVVLDNAGFATFVPSDTSPETGYFVYPLDNALLAAPFDLGRGQAGAPRPVVDKLLGIGNLGFVAVSATGTLAYIDGSLLFLNTTLTWVDRAGRTQDTVGIERVWGEASLSPGGEYAVAGVLETETLTADLWLLELDGARPSRMNLSGVNGSVVWVPPDGERMVYTYLPNLGGNRSELRVVTTEGNAAPTTIAEFNSLGAYATSISADGAALIGSARSTAARAATDIFVLALDEVLARGTPATEADIAYLVQSEFNESHASFSPDGRWIAYVSDETGMGQVYVIPYPGPGRKIPVSTDGGRQPRWNPAGGELFYVSGNRMMSVAVDTTDGFGLEVPEGLFTHDALSQSSSANADAYQYDVSPDGQAFVLLAPFDVDAEPQQLRVIVNWTAELDR